MRFLVGLSIAVCLKVLVPAAAAAQTYTFSSLEVPNARNTNVADINDRSQIVGYVDEDDSATHGFLRSNGEVTFFDVPGAFQTWASGINNKGQIVGSYTVRTGTLISQPRGFLLDRGQFTTILPPGASVSNLFGINDVGQIVGNAASPGGGGIRGFLYTHGKFVELPGNPVFPFVPDPFGINRSGQIVAFNAGISARIDPDGRVTVIRQPFGADPVASDINDRGEIVGVVGVWGFVLAAGVFSHFNGPDDQNAAPTAINNRGQIVGAGARIGAFLATPIGIKEDVSADPSPSESRIPVVTFVVDRDLATWTLGPGQEILRDGVQMAGGYGSEILWYQDSIYVLGDDHQWWRWTGLTWELFGPNDPSH